MIRRLILIDVLLISLVVFGALRFRSNWRAFWSAHRPETIQAASEPAPPAASIAAPAATNLSDWSEIAARNPFSFDRTDTPIIATPPVAEPLAPKPILFATMTLGNDSVA